MPTETGKQNRLLLDNHFKLGLFSQNCSSGLSVTKVPERWVNSWENNVNLSQMVDAAGLDFLLPIARWIGYGGETNFHYDVLETMTWAAGLLALTERITVVSTTHTAFNHPVVAAKQLATLDRIGNGRAALNIVCGWNKPEYDALGVQLPDDHETRYGYGQEWFDVVSKLWAEKDPFDWEGKYFNLHNVHSDPKPVRGVPPVVNAAGSKQGREFATKNVDFLFTPTIELERSRDEVVALQEQARTQNRDLDVLTLSFVVCRETEAEAKAYLKHYADTNADWEAVDNLIRLQFAHAQSFPHDMLAMIRDRMAAGHGSYPLVGNPEQVADKICELAEAGFAGTTLCFCNYVDEFPYFRDNVLPILEDRGLRLSNSIT